MKPIHKHLLIRAEVNQPPREPEQQYIRDWMTCMIDDIGMKLLYGPIVKYVKVKGNEGMTAMAMIETSHIAMHIWEKQDPPIIQLDVYTCGPFVPEIVLKALQEFDPIKLHWKYLDRQFNIRTMDIGIWTEGDPWPNKSILTTG
jgi:S-adenosylmethionine/arginine decarboxylase-like enzyme